MAFVWLLIWFSMFYLRYSVISHRTAARLGKDPFPGGCRRRGDHSEQTQHPAWGQTRPGGQMGPLPNGERGDPSLALSPGRLQGDTQSWGGLRGDVAGCRGASVSLRKGLRWAGDACLPWRRNTAWELPTQTRHKRVRTHVHTPLSSETLSLDPELPCACRTCGRMCLWLSPPWGAAEGPQVGERGRRNPLRQDLRWGLGDGRRGLWRVQDQPPRWLLRWHPSPSCPTPTPERLLDRPGHLVAGNWLRGVWAGCGRSGWGREAARTLCACSPEQASCCVG